MSANLGSLNVELSANTATFQSDLGRAAQIAQTNMEKINRAVDKAKTALEALGIGLSIHAFADMVKGTIEAADQLGKMSQKVGVSVEALSALQYSAKLSDVSLQQLGTGMEKLSKNMLAVEQGAGHAIASIGSLGVTAKGGAAAAFAQLNINVEASKGHLKSSEQTMLEVADKFAAMKDGAVKTALAMQLFGKSGAELIPLLNEGSAAIKAQREEAERLGIVMTTEMSAAATEMMDNLKRLDARTEGLKIALAKSLLPALIDIINAIIELNGKQVDADSFFSGIGKVARIAATAIGSTWLALKDMGDGIGAAAAQVNAVMHGDLALAREIGKERDAQAAKNEKQFNDFQNHLMNGSPASTALKSEKSHGGGEDPFVKKPAPNARGANQGQAFLDSLKKQIALNSAYRDAAGAIGLNESAALRLEAAQKKVSAAAEPLIKKLQQEKDNLKFLNQEQKDYNEMQKKLGEDVAAQSKAADDYIQSLKVQSDEQMFQASLLGQTIINQQKLTEARKVDMAVQKLIFDAREKGAVSDDVISSLRARAEEQKKIIIDEIDARKAAENDWLTGAQAGMNTYLDSANNTYAQAAQAAQSAFKSMEDALVSFTTTGKLDFKSFANSVISQIIRIEAHKAVAQAVSSAASSSWVGSAISILGNLFGGANNGGDMGVSGGEIGNASALSRPKASGGPVSGGTSYLVGEKGPEIFTPSGSGKIIPNSAISGGGGSPINMYITTPDANSFRASQGQITASMARALQSAQRNL
jgi:lambda family phage tail tape measure protein